MKKLIQQWIDNLSIFGKYIEHHIIEGKETSHHIRGRYSENMYYALIEYRNTYVDFDEAEKAMGCQFPEDLKETFKESFFRLEDEDGNIYTGLSTIGLGSNSKFPHFIPLTEKIKLELTPDAIYSKDEIHLIEHGIVIGKSHLSDDSAIFLACNSDKQAMIGIHNHDDYFVQVEPYSLTALLSLINTDFEEFKECIIEGFEDDEVEY